MVRALKLVDHFCKLAVESSSSSSGLLVNMPMLVKDSFSKPRTISSVPSISTSGQLGRIFANHTFYKGKAALRMEPVAPEFCPLNAGGDSGALKISRAGTLMLEFAHSVGERKYDWNKKQMFALSVTELGCLISLSPNESCEFFHDPLMGKSGSGKIQKVLQLTPRPNASDASGYFIRLKVSNKIAQIEEQFNMPITKAEFTLMRSAFNYVLPYFLGWHAFANSISIREQASTASG
ncbi:hypothetical protein SUGI_0552160 [Cryptomeria japonica]|uniref:single-stranded DNA-binding protein WHY1, chloroplastic isoform X2 n=1 Tax=Cryptomeria japonica TaxID=3369 RepID=UPI002408BFDA|nr:single-stranded DNA-binding protein WHY1, chloroplastic isoform X2 [Cryptomeria japonica]GLJ28111.1 hypothetical protein SUGI_0552160 [Cryptomeria japonica]